MAKHTRPPVEDLGPRESEVLRSLIHAHLATGEPVGSKAVSRELGLELSPATIRNIMASLAERGMLSQPHTSAGRVPTDSAYRIYVDRLMDRPRIAASRARAIAEALERSTGEFDDLLTEASRQLAQLSTNVGVVMAPTVRRIVVQRLEFVRVHDRRVVAILIGRSGLVHHRILDVPEAFDQEELNRIARYLSDEFSGMTIPAMRQAVLARMREVRQAYDRLRSRGLDLGRRTLEGREGETEVFVDGAANLLSKPEFADVETLRALLRALEEKQRLVALLSRVLESQGAQVVIGQESLDADLTQCSVVASSYYAGRRVMGTVAIVGPKRMEYGKAVALVDCLATVLTRLLTDPFEGGSGA